MGDELGGDGLDGCSGVVERDADDDGAGSVGDVEVVVAMGEGTLTVELHWSQAVECDVFVEDELACGVSCVWVCDKWCEVVVDEAVVVFCDCVQVVSDGNAVVGAIESAVGRWVEAGVVVWVCVSGPGVVAFDFVPLGGSEVVAEDGVGAVFAE